MHSTHRIFVCVVNFSEAARTHHICLTSLLERAAMSAITIESSDEERDRDVSRSPRRGVPLTQEAQLVLAALVCSGAPAVLGQMAFKAAQKFEQLATTCWKSICAMWEACFFLLQHSWGRVQLCVANCSY